MASGADEEGLIDVRDLIARYSDAEHAARADAYFATIPDDDPLMRKPFFGIRATQSNLHGVAEVLQLARLYQGARVLDFGAGTGWFSRMLAMLDCRPIAVDVSAAALALGQRAFARDPAASGLAIDWRPFDGVTLPLPNGAVDRIISFDAFHHVADQSRMLAEFHRVLEEGGRAIFHEPGPDHSRNPVSQFEMRHRQVIENDIVIETIWAAASSLGFTNLERALTSPRTLSVSLDRYQRIIAGDAGMRDVTAVLDRIAEGGAHLRVFAMTKGEDRLDSRNPAGLAGVCEVMLDAAAGPMLRGRARVTNTGRAVWRPSTGEIGAVHLGMKQPDDPVQQDFGRIFLSATPVAPGESVSFAFEVAGPVERPSRLAFDLVAEGVTWFETLGGKPVTITLP